jgi:hypothetical protein
MKASRLKLLACAALMLLAACSSATASLPFALAPESDLPDFVHDAPHRVREAYQFAIANQEELAKYPCYCGCGAMGHESNLNCYLHVADTRGTLVFDTHAVGCGICVDITQDVMRLLREGKTSPEIRTYIDAQYGSFGPPTNTAFPLT